MISKLIRERVLLCDWSKSFDYGFNRADIVCPDRVCVVLCDWLISSDYSLVGQTASVAIRD